MDEDDLIRRDVINSIICRHSLDFTEIENRYDIEFNKYFSEEINLLKDLLDDGMLIFAGRSIEVTSLGRIFIRHICKVFDRCLRDSKDAYRISGP